LVLNGDEAGWRKQIENGAVELGLLTGQFRRGAFVVSDGRSIPLSDCKVERG
jgi:hypothetical protein